MFDVKGLVGCQFPLHKTTDGIYIHPLQYENGLAIPIPYEFGEFQKLYFSEHIPTRRVEDFSKFCRVFIGLFLEESPTKSQDSSVTQLIVQPKAWKGSMIKERKGGFLAQMLCQRTSRTTIAKFPSLQVSPTI